MYTEDQLLPLSAVSQYVHCPRRCALIHLEQTWLENELTAEGRVLHSKAHGGENESRGNLKIIRNLRLRSLRLGISGITDIVEFHRRPPDEGGVAIPFHRGTWLPFPVEYKRGAAKNAQSYAIQLCAQALCLEDMLSVKISEGALFLGVKQHRTVIAFDASLRGETESVCQAIHDLFDSGFTPPAIYNKRCLSCSLIDICMPQSIGAYKSASKWLERQIEETIA